MSNTIRKKARSYFRRKRSEYMDIAATMQRMNPRHKGLRFGTWLGLWLGAAIELFPSAVARWWRSKPSVSAEVRKAEAFRSGRSQAIADTIENWLPTELSGDISEWGIG